MAISTNIKLLQDWPFSNATVSFYLAQTHQFFTYSPRQMLERLNNCSLFWSLGYLEASQAFRKKYLFSFAITHCVLWVWCQLIYKATIKISCCRFNDFSMLLPEIFSCVKFSLAFWVPFSISKALFCLWHQVSCFPTLVFFLLHKVYKVLLGDSWLLNLLSDCKLLFCYYSPCKR